ncbi:class I adenylate-forming enzyme family protein [Novosphingobium album (ex Hu et al. 2023)]|uniref:Acyl--CoA ligase n=1 Tax=Novosphingobium album (ex Hu et al. 2023) TaxID=2930093 RepID=A0ABT0AYM2_9SPHN|nr:class I adenylate-forming enzyme family protein [Novosphingobium album (ex Hu et al. 2023)]MCJ2177781.1 acyl--CoA ligase [Novosphingobium album (ex Hu et al. 2023)]
MLETDAHVPADALEEVPSTVPDLLAAAVRDRGEADAIATVAETITYRELDQRSARLARALLTAGAGKGTRIALLAPDGIFWITAFLASLRIGALLTCLSTLASPKELGHMLRNSDVQFLLAARRFLSHDYGEKLAVAFPELDAATAGQLQITAAPYLRRIWMDDPSGLPWSEPVEGLLALADGHDAPSPSLLTAAEAQVRPADEAVIVYTSGSTSLPKAVVHSQWNVTRHPPELAKLFLVKAGDRMLPMLPAFWLGGMAMAMQVLSQGATLVYPASPDLDTVLETIQRCGVTRLNGWGDGLVRLRALATERGIDADAIVGLGPFRDEAGELIPPHLQSNMLGMSETFAPHSAEPINARLPADKPGASGRAVNAYERRVVDPETGLEVTTGDVGELQLRGGALMNGFYGKRRCEVFTPDGYYPTGDLVRIDSDGYLTFVARRNDMIKTRAANVSRLEVEAALRELPGVANCVVTGLPDAEFGQIVAAAVVPAEGTEPDADLLREMLRGTVSSYKVPRRILFVSENDIPRTTTGKLKLDQLAGLFP